MDKDKELAEAAKELYSEPTIHETETKCLPNGQAPCSVPDGFKKHIKSRQEAQENGINIGLI